MSHGSGGVHSGDSFSLSSSDIVNSGSAEGSIQSKTQVRKVSATSVLHGESGGANEGGVCDNGDSQIIGEVLGLIEVARRVGGVLG